VITECNDRPSVKTLHIDGAMDIYRAGDLKQQLFAELEAVDALDLDLSGVSEFDSAGLQLLMLAQRMSHNRGASLRLIGSSDVVREVFGLLRLSPDQGVAGDDDASPQSLHLLGR
jgi:anti-sigma B factor antagonist